MRRILFLLKCIFLFLEMQGCLKNYGNKLDDIKIVNDSKYYSFDTTGDTQHWRSF